MVISFFVIPAKAKSAIRKSGGGSFAAARANTKTLTRSSPLRIIVTTSDLRSLALPATNGDEPVDAMNLVSLRRGPTKETFIEA
jgi:hypothetical protein